MNDVNYRGAVINEILDYARADERIVLMAGDMGFGVIDMFKQQFPDRIYNIGIMEQGMVGIAAGMAMTGLRPIIYCMVNFLAFRSIEQVRNDIVQQELNVKLIGTGANDYFKFLGDSHCCGQDDKTIMELIGMRVFDPYLEDAPEFSSLVKDWILDDRAGYIRV